jgi:hypothetical protein
VASASCFTNLPHHQSHTHISNPINLMSSSKNCIIAASCCRSRFFVQAFFSRFQVPLLHLKSYPSYRLFITEYRAGHVKRLTRPQFDHTDSHVVHLLRAACPPCKNQEKTTTTFTTTTSNYHRLYISDPSLLRLTPHLTLCTIPNRQTRTSFSTRPFPTCPLHHSPPLGCTG